MLLLSCSERRGGRNDVSAERVKKETAEAVDATSKYLAQQQEEYEKQIREKLKDLDAKTEELRAGARKAKGQTKRQLDQQVREMEGKTKDLREKLQELRSSSARAWKDMKAGIDAALEDLEKSYEKAVSRFKQEQ